MGPPDDKEVISEKISNLKPPEMIKNASDYDVYKRRLQRWSRLSSLNPQSQFDLVMNSIDFSNELCEKLEREIGESEEAKTKGVEVILDKLKEWFGKEEEIDAFRNYREFEEKRRENNQDLLEFVNEWESAYKKCKDRGDTFSDRVLAFKLMVSANLNEMDHKLVFRESNSNENDGQIYGRTKKAIRMFYNAGTLKTLNETKVLVNERKIDEDLDEQLKISLISRGWKAPKRKANDEAPYTKWFKCKFCRCKCTPPFKKCACPCSNHKSYNCPSKPDAEDGKSKADGDTVNSQVSIPVSQSSLGKHLNVQNIMLVTLADEPEANRTVQELSSLLNDSVCIPKTADNHCSDLSSSDEDDNVVVLKTKLDDKTNLEKGARAIIDSGSPITIAGIEWFKTYYRTLPKAIRAKLEVKSSKLTFQFGGGERRKSLGILTVPFYILDDEFQAHMVMITVELVEASICLLLGGSSLDAAEAVMQFGKTPFVSLPKILGAGTRIPLNKEPSGHYAFYVDPPTPEDDKTIASTSLEEDTWSALKSHLAISYVTKATNPDYEPLLDEKVLVNSVGKRRGQTKSNQEELSKKDIIKLHHYFGHCTVERLEKLIKKAGRWNPKYVEIMEEIRKCQVCAVESKRKSLPKTAIPRASNFNQLVTMDIKYNTKHGKNEKPYILYIIDAFTRYKSAVFISDKSAVTVVEAFLINWIRIFGRPTSVHFDRGCEFINNEMQTLCDKYDIKITSTAAYSPNQNGLNEKNHHYVDFMMTKIMTADKGCSPEIALTWAIHASNVLENRFGVSPSMLVFGRNIVAHPDLCLDAPPSLESPADISKRIASHLNAIAKAREAFIQAESNLTITDALKDKLSHRPENLEVGKWIYFKNFETKQWQGPTKVIMIDNKNVFTIRNNKLVSINKDHVVLQRSEFENLQPYLTLPPVLTEETENSVEKTSNDKNTDEARETRDQGSEHSEVLDIQKKNNSLVSANPPENTVIVEKEPNLSDSLNDDDNHGNEEDSNNRNDNQLVDPDLNEDDSSSSSLPLNFHDNIQQEDI